MGRWVRRRTPFDTSAFHKVVHDSSLVQVEANALIGPVCVRRSRVRGSEGRAVACRSPWFVYVSSRKIVRANSFIDECTSHGEKGNFSVFWESWEVVCGSDGRMGYKVAIVVSVGYC